MPATSRCTDVEPRSTAAPTLLSGTDATGYQAGGGGGFRVLRRVAGLAALVAAGLAVVADLRVGVFRVVAFRVLAFVVAVPEGFRGVAALGLAEGVTVGVADGVAALEAAAVAAVEAFALPVPAALPLVARAAFGLVVLARRRTVVPETSGRAWRSFTPLTSAASSRTSAVTSASRTVRFSRFLLVA
jgi:hypothetical protein